MDGLYSRINSSICIPVSACGVIGKIGGTSLATRRNDFAGWTFYRERKSRAGTMCIYVIQETFYMDDILWKKKEKKKEKRKQIKEKRKRILFLARRVKKKRNLLLTGLIHGLCV